VNATTNTTTTDSEQVELLDAYLNDHLMGACGGVELARRLARTFADPGGRAALQDLAVEIEKDRQTLMDVMARLDVPKSSVKMAAGWLGEKLGRLKPNGSLFHRTALTPVVELEAMHLGVEGKEAGWRLLRALADRDLRLHPSEFDRLIDRAARQKQILDELRHQAATAAFS
jgi:hypothetical protein